ncbi:MAG TPA: SgcJ/EcaC family oxidoreductase [Chloroflexota bacterium]|nr:SgcJ/EcaC family oxidoreductase [Chloroflexota bacterium]
MSNVNQRFGDRSDALRAIEQTYKQLIEAWNRRDAAGMASLLSPEALVIGFDGSTMVGREDVRVTLDAIFRDHATQPYVTKICSIRMISFHTGLVHAIVGMVPPGANDVEPALNAIQAAVVSAQEDGHYRIELFQNTPAQYHGRPEQVAAHTEELRQVRSRAR